MNKQTIDKLVKLANHLDEKGYFKEADVLDSAIEKLASDYAQESEANDQSFSESLEAIKDSSREPVQIGNPGETRLDTYVWAIKNFPLYKQVLTELYDQGEYLNSPKIHYLFLEAISKDFRQSDFRKKLRDNNILH